ncbi:unnamed protein product [Didymodactylos carnosus]|uniref:C2 domain-containing protein n=1 Tax=Didymodactylos carnosus TaxID=1234261 RepID=A0A813PF62_9BILA|nr:unnamed protein product [Didymodactylos carnosus]CAF0850534.1 unnamed protein product [Didymodactylos carnosus]CAF3532427.1 unnamed protein product [Didymodactylos carnosus]CAF3635771.1 unnamed protein product [Didymodactylos carnosus]
MCRRNLRNDLGMASFFRRMSSIVKQTHKNKSTDNITHDEESNADDSSPTILRKQIKNVDLSPKHLSLSKEQHFQQLRKRRCSAPVLMLRRRVDALATCDEDDEINSSRNTYVDANIRLSLEQMLLQGKTQHMLYHQTKSERINLWYDIKTQKNSLHEFYLFIFIKKTKKHSIYQNIYIMAKFGSFFRRIFSSFSSDDNNNKNNNNNNNNDDNNDVQMVNKKIQSECGSSMIETNSNHSCDVIIIPSTNNRIGKQLTIQDNISNNSNYLSSSLSIHKNSCRRLSVPNITSPSSNDIKNQLLTSLHRLSLSSPSKNVLSSTAISGTTSPSTSSIALSNSNMSSIEFKTGTPPTVPSPRLNNQSNNSPSPNAMKDISPSDTNNQIDNSRKMSLPNRGRRPSMFDPIDPTELQAALYATAVAKSNSTSCQTSDEDQKHAYIRCSISYDRDNDQIQIDNICFENIFSLESLTPQQGPQYTPCDPTTASSFYCRFRLYPERRSVFQTKIIRHNRTSQSHLFDDKLTFEMKPELLINHSIEILVYTISKNFKDVRVGTARFDLHELYDSDRIRVRKVLNETDNNTNQDPDLGELLISMSYLPSAGKLAVVIMEAKNLRPLSVESKVLPDPCVKVTLLRDGRKIKRKKTSVQRSTDNPMFNEELVFELRKEVAGETMIEIRIVHESLSWKENLGCVLFGASSSTGKTEENLYWKTVLDGQSLKAEWQMLKPAVNTPTNFSDRSAEILAEVISDPSLLQNFLYKNPIELGVQKSFDLSEHEVNTVRFDTESKGINHTEGGWPKDVNITEHDQIRRYRRKVEKDDAYLNSLSRLARELEFGIKQQNSIDIYQEYFQNKLDDFDEPFYAKTVNLYSYYANVNKSANHIAWQEGKRKIAVSYCNLDFNSQTLDAIDSLVWDMENPNKPETVLKPNSPLTSVEFNQKDTHQLLAGCHNGQVCIFDLRKGNTPVEQSFIENSHRELVRNAVWLQSKSGTEFFSTAADGKIYWWDTKKMSEPVDQLILDVEKKNRLEYALGATCLEYDSSISCTRKSKSDSDRINVIYHGHSGPVYSLQRHQFFNKIFLSVGDWTVRLWSEEVRDEFILSSRPGKYHLTDGQFSPGRPGVLITSSTDGSIHIWDLLFKPDEPVLIVKLAEEPIVCLRFHEAGRYIACGAKNGNVTLLELSDSLCILNRNEKQLMASLPSEEETAIQLEKSSEQFWNIVKDQKRSLQERLVHSQNELLQQEETDSDTDELTITTTDKKANTPEL